MTEPILSVLNLSSYGVWRLVKKVCVAAIGVSPSENGLDGVEAFQREERAEAYLRRIVALTGAMQIGQGYDLEVGKTRVRIAKTRFHVGDRSVMRRWDRNDSKSACMYTCFYCTRGDIPKAEQIATVLLQLTNNPALFEKWAVQKGVAFKADGQSFTPRAVASSPSPAFNTAR